ncbi:uncharacterized protein LOC131226779 [Magnolia sinica]|uniref:uncharacterized protein LOC131226779 n=1 Tax=Magnolia sinica TaxID=86752 RepID=UPI0026587092|nr:uncharacterized protein LOC131226779 [Magnolia sinica]
MEESEKEKENEVKEIEACSDPSAGSTGDESQPNPKPRSVKIIAPEIEIHLFRCGKGPIDVFKSRLGGWDQDQLEVHDILEKYGFKSIFAFNPISGRGVSIRFNPRNGRSLLPYRDGSVIYIDGEPKDSMIKPITKILLGTAVLALLLAVFLRETPEWLKTSNFLG